MTDKYNGAKFIHFEIDEAYVMAYDTRNGHYGGATVAYREVNGNTYVGVAHCHEKDRYVKAYGRAKAMGLLYQLLARPELDGSENTVGVKQFIVSGEPDHRALISMMYEEGYVPR